MRENGGRLRWRRRQENDNKDSRIFVFFLSSCRLSLSLLTLCHSRLDQQADRRRKKRKKYISMKGRNLRVIYSSKTYSTFIHASVFVCLRNDVVLSIMLEFSSSFLCLPRLVLFDQTSNKHNERETIHRPVGVWNEARQSLNDTQMLVIVVRFFCLENWPTNPYYSSLAKETRNLVLSSNVSSRK